MLAAAVMLPTAAQADCGDPPGQYVHYSGCNLFFAQLSTTDLSFANLSGADLTLANLRETFLIEAILSGAKLTLADLTDANLTTAILTSADLTSAILRDADLRDADLTGANLEGADLSGADLFGSNLSNANLSYTDLTGAILFNLTFAGVQGLVIENVQDYTFDLLASDPAPVINYGVTARLGRNGAMSSHLVFDIPSGSSFDDGVTTVTAQVVDALGNVAAQTSFTVTVNRFPATPPVITAPANVDLLLDPILGSVTINLNQYVSATDVTGGPANVSFFFKRLPGDRYTNLTGAQITALQLTEGSYEVFMIADDASGQTSTATMIIDVLAPKPATLDVVVTPASAPASEPRTLRYTLTLPDGAGDVADVSFQVFAPDSAGQGSNLYMRFIEVTDIDCGGTISRTQSDLAFSVATQMSPGESCSVEALLNVPMQAPVQTYEVKPSFVVTYFEGQSSDVSVLPPPTQVPVTIPFEVDLDVYVDPHYGVVGEQRSLVFNVWLPPNAPDYHDIWVDFDFDGPPDGINFASGPVPLSGCGPNALMQVTEGTQSLDVIDISFPRGQGGDCVFTLPLTVDETVPVGRQLLPGPAVYFSYTDAYTQREGQRATFHNDLEFSVEAEDPLDRGPSTPPVANPDTNSVSESVNFFNLSALPATGNVVGPDGLSAGDVADINPAPPQTGPLVSFEVNGISYLPGDQVVTRYGIIIFNSDGSYRYELATTGNSAITDDRWRNVKALRGGETAVETFTYTIENETGQQDSSTLTITINGFEDFVGPSFVEIVIGATEGPDVFFQNQNAATISGADRISRQEIRYFDPVYGNFTVRNSSSNLPDRVFEVEGVVGEFDHSQQNPFILQLGSVILTDLEGDESEVMFSLGIPARPPLNLSFTTSDLIGNSIPIGAFVGTLASNDADSGLTYALVDKGTSTRGDCADDLHNNLFRIDGDRLESKGGVPPGTYVFCGEVTNAGGTYQQSFNVTVLATDTVAPTLQVSDIDQPLDPGANTALVSFTAEVSENTDEVITPTFTLADGTEITSPYAFPSGVNTVTARAEDAAGNVATETFTVTTYPDAPLTITTRVLGGPLSPGTSITYEATLTNPNGVALSNVAALVALGQSTGTLPAPAGVTYDNLSRSVGCTGTLTPVGGNGLGVQTTNLSFPANSTCTFSGRFSVDDTTPEGVFPVFGVLSYDTGRPPVQTVRNDLTPVVYNAPDVEAPVITPPDTVLRSTDTGEAFATVDVTSFGSVTDNRTPLPAIVYRTGGEVISGPRAFPIGDTIVTMEAVDEAGNAATPVQFIVRVTDGEPPVITVPADITVPTDAGLATAVVAFTVTASDSVDGDLTGALDVTPPSGTIFELGTTPVTASVTDAAGNRAEATFTVTVTDGEAPVITPPDAIVVDLAAGEATAMVAFDATVVDNADPDVTPIYLINGAPITSPHAFPLGITTVTVDATDSGGNAAAQASFTVTVRDVTSPTITLSADRTTLLAGDVALLTFTLSEPATDFTAADITVTGGTLSDFAGAGDLYTARFTPAADTTGDGVVFVGDDAFSDAAGNMNADGAEADNTLTFTIDTHIPTAQISALTGPVNGTFSATITLSRPSDDFTVEDLELENATAVLTGSGSDYTVVLTPLGDGRVSVTVARESFSSASGATNLDASETVSVIYDGTPPDVTITGLPDAFSGQATFDLTITFGENVTGFAAADLALTNATVTGLSGTGALYSAQVMATGQGDVTVQVPAAVAFDSAGNGNLASDMLTSMNDTVAVTQPQINSFMSNRANLLVSSQPDLTCHLSGGCNGGNAQLRLEKGALSYHLYSRPNGPVWFRLNGTHSRDDSAETDYLFGAIGTHRQLSDNTLLGLMFELDHVARADGNSAIEGTGWLVGPYFVTRLPDQPLYFEGRLLGGMTDNRITPFGTYTDRFETRRWLAQFKVSGRLEYGETTLTPSLQASYIWDKQLPYTDSLGNLIPEQGIEQGQLDLGLDFQTPVRIADHLWVLGGGMAAVYSSTSSYGGITAGPPSHDGLRGRIRLTGTTVLDNGAQLNLGVSFDGIGSDGFEAVGLEVGLQWEF